MRHLHFRRKDYHMVYVDAYIQKDDFLYNEYLHFFLLISLFVAIAVKEKSSY